MHDVGTGDGILQATREHYGKKVFEMMSEHISKQDFESSRNKIRTAPLWGVRLRPRLMRDGESLRLRDAIMRHRGEASHERDRFEDLKKEDRKPSWSFSGHYEFPLAKLPMPLRSFSAASPGSCVAKLSSRMWSETEGSISSNALRVGRP